MLLNDKELLQMVEEDGSFIQPFSRKNLQSSSYDVTLSSEIQVLKGSTLPINISDQEAVDRIYETRNISGGYLIKPGEYVLCRLQERITLPDDVVAFVAPRTRFTRLGLLLSNQYCNPSYSGILSLGLWNASGNNISLVPGLTIGQLVFCRLSGEPFEQNLYRVKSNAAYQGETSFRGADFGGERIIWRGQKYFGWDARASEQGLRCPVFLANLWLNPLNLAIPMLILENALRLRRS